MTTIAVCQPYFLPYPGYFRMFAAADLFVMLDDVQQIRQGFMHRNQFRLADGRYAWLTLPMEKAPRSTHIRNLRFTDDARERLEAQMRRFPIFAKSSDLRARILTIDDDDVTAYLIDLLCHVAGQLDIDRPVLRASRLEIDPTYRGQERIIEICKRMGATHYINPSGGRALYDAKTFAASGIELGFLSAYTGKMDSIATRLLAGDDVAEEIRRETVIEWMS